MEKPENKGYFYIPPEVSRVTRRLEEEGFEAYLIGGCVRDVLLGRKPKDWDVTTNAKPEEIIRLFEHTFYENSFGTVGVVSDNPSDPALEVVEATTYRIESTYSDSRHPDEVSFSTNILDDLKRRDFTVNAIAVAMPPGEKDIFKGQFVDPYNGQADLAGKIIRTVENPIDRFREDALRILRAIRLSAELGFTINQETMDGIRETAHTLKNIATERIRDEFVRILLSDRPKQALELAHDLGVLQYVIHETEEGIGVKQNKAHAFDVWEHSLRTLQHAADKKWPLHIRLAALLHDVGKPATRRWSPEKKEWTFYGHEVVGARMAKTILNRLKFSRETMEIVVKLVRWHMFFSDTEQITHSAVRRMIQNVGHAHVWDLMNVRVCDRIGTGRPKENPYRLRKYKSMVEEVMRDPVSVGMLKIDGARVMEVSRITPGPKIGWILHALLEEVLEDPGLNNPEYLEKRTVELAAMPDQELRAMGEKGKEKKDEEEEKSLKEIRGKYWVE